LNRIAGELCVTLFDGAREHRMDVFGIVFGLKFVSNSIAFLRAVFSVLQIKGDQLGRRLNF